MRPAIPTCKTSVFTPVPRMYVMADHSNGDLASQSLRYARYWNLIVR
jgi:hypothetical protein